jgi:GNAT superfamily N-acetyltransferase
MSAVLAEVQPAGLIPYDPRYRDQVIQIASEMHADSMFRDYRLDPDKLIAQIQAAETRPDELYFRMAVANGEVFGGFYGMVTRMFFSDEKMGKDIGWWVKRTRRGSWAAFKLLAGFEEWARSKGAKKCFIGQTSEIDVERTTRLYELCGYRIIGMNTVKDL